MSRGRPPTYPAALAAIEALRLKVGAQLPAEAVLVSHCGVHRLTVRRALAELRRQGRLESRAGKGHFWVGAHGVRHFGWALHHLPSEGPLPPYSARVLQGAEAVLGGERYHWVHLLQEHASAFLDRTRLDGLAVLSPQQPDNGAWLQALRSRGLPLVTVNHFEPEIDGVRSASLPAMRLLAEACAAAGCQRLFLFAHHTRFQDVPLRWASLAAEAKDLGMECRPDQAIYGPALSAWSKKFFSLAAYRARRQALVMAHPPMVFELFKLCGPALSRRLHQDLRLICLSDHPDLARLPVTVTAVQQPLDEMGGWAARRLMTRLANPDEEVAHEELGPAMAWRDTLSAPPGHSAAKAASSSLTVSSSQKWSQGGF